MRPLSKTIHCTVEFRTNNNQKKKKKKKSCGINADIFFVDDDFSKTLGKNNKRYKKNKRRATIWLLYVVNAMLWGCELRCESTTVSIMGTHLHVQNHASFFIFGIQKKKMHFCTAIYKKIMTQSFREKQNKTTTKTVKTSAMSFVFLFFSTSTTYREKEI